MMLMRQVSIDRLYSPLPSKYSLASPCIAACYSSDSCWSTIMLCSDWSRAGHVTEYWPLIGWELLFFRLLLIDHNDPLMKLSKVHILPADQSRAWPMREQHCVTWPALNQWEASTVMINCGFDWSIKIFDLTTLVKLTSVETIFLAFLSNIFIRFLFLWVFNLVRDIYIEDVGMYVGAVSMMIGNMGSHYSRKEF